MTRRTWAFSLALALIALATCPPALAEDAPSLDSLWSVDMGQGQFMQSVIGDFNGDSVNDVLTVIRHWDRGGEWSVTLLDGRSGDAVWEKTYSPDHDYVILKEPIPGDRGANAMVATVGTGFAVNILNGRDGSTLWVHAGFFPMYCEQVTVRGRECLAISGFYYRPGSGGHLVILDLRDFTLIPTDIDTSSQLLYFVVDRSSKSRELLVTHTDRGIVAYRLRDWSLAWEYDFLDNDVYYINDFTFMNIDQGELAFQARKGDAYRSIIVLDMRDGSELRALDTDTTGLSLQRLMGFSRLDRDPRTDFLVYGYSDELKPTFCALNGSDGSVMWSVETEFHMYEDRDMAVKLVDLSGDGRFDLLLAGKGNITLVSGIDGSVILNRPLGLHPDGFAVARGMMENGGANIVHHKGGDITAMRLTAPDDGGVPKAMLFSTGVLALVGTGVAILFWMKTYKKGGAGQGPSPEVGKRETEEENGAETGPRGKGI